MVEKAIKQGILEIPPLNSLNFANQEAVSNSSNVIVVSIENSNATILYLVCFLFPSPILHPKFNFETFCAVINGQLYQLIFFSRMIRIVLFIQLS